MPNFPNDMSKGVFVLPVAKCSWQCLWDASCTDRPAEGVASVMHTKNLISKSLVLKEEKKKIMLRIQFLHEEKQQGLFLFHGLAFL